MKQPSFLSYAFAALIITILAVLIYATVQQSHRSTADDPQLQIARDISERLSNNQSIDLLMKGDTINLAKSLAVFTVLYDTKGEPLRSNGLLEGLLPRIPKGVLDYTRKHNEDVLTWQPRTGIRMALVVELVQSPGQDIAFVAVGRSLQEVEKRISSLTMMVLLGWLGCLGFIFLHWLITTFQRRNI